MARGTYCLDTSVLVKILVPEEGSAEATALLRRIVSGGHRLVAPAFAWAEVGTVLRKKVKAGLLSESEADARWAGFLSLSIDYLEGRRIQETAWEIAAKFDLASMYDAAFLAVSEVSVGDTWNAAEFWTADRELLRSLGQEPPGYVHLLCGP